VLGTCYDKIIFICLPAEYYQIVQMSLPQRTWAPRRYKCIVVWS